MKRPENRTHTGDCRAARKTPKPKNMAKPTPQIQKISFIWGDVIGSNENKMSDGGQDRASLGVWMLKSS